MSAAFDLAKTRFAPDGLVPVVAQDERTGDVLMVAWADREALEATVRTGLVHYHSRSRGALWKKGETSGNVQRLVSLALDCDGDAVLAMVRQEGVACHTGATSCFGDGRGVLSRLQRTIHARAVDPKKSSYTSRLLADPNLRIKKIGEETAELVAALATQDPAAVREEAADLVYHLMVALNAAHVSWADVMDVLASRERNGPSPDGGRRVRPLPKQGL